MIETLFYSIDWELFSWIATPIISLLAFLVYGAALYTSINQNKITTSASLIPYYEEEIVDVIESGKDLELTGSLLDVNSNGFNFANQFVTALVFLKLDIYYQKDIDEGNFNACIGLKDLPKKSYGRNLIFLDQFFSLQSNLGYYLKKIERLILNIESSELTLSHKKILKSKIRNKLAMEFLICYYNIRWKTKEVPSEIPVSIMLDYDAKQHLMLTKIEDTEFFKLLSWVDKKLTKE